VSPLDPVRAAIAEIAEYVDRKRGWYSLRRLGGTIVLFGIRYRLRHRNLYDTAAVDPPARDRLPVRRQYVRTLDGRGTDAGERTMGAAGEHFGRNAPAVEPRPGLPAPSRVSAELLARRTFLPADRLNLLAAAWVQFEVHDWIQHRIDVLDRLVPAQGSTSAVPRFTSEQTHWWDASQLYGTDRAFVEHIRADPESGEVKVDDELLRAIERFIGRRPARVPNLWLGLALFHVLFAREHNAICAALRKHERRLALTGDALFDKARLINAAVMAKVHTLEWTPAMIAHPTTEHSIRAIWYGLLGKHVRRLGRIGSGELLSGIPGSRTRHDGVRYSLTEEFVAVYRMHPLIPDDVAFKSVRNGQSAGGPIDLAARDIERTRECKIPAYNDFRRLFRLEPAETFDDLAGGDTKLAREIAAVYDAPDHVDLMVGLFAEPKPPGFAFSDTAFRVFVLMAARRLRSDRLFTTDYTADVYTPTGMRWIRQATLSRMLARNYPQLAPVLTRVDNPFKPWPSAV
jgi:hypothetical protein